MSTGVKAVKSFPGSLALWWLAWASLLALLACINWEMLDLSWNWMIIGSEVRTKSRHPLNIIEASTLIRSHALVLQSSKQTGSLSRFENHLDTVVQPIKTILSTISQATPSTRHPPLRCLLRPAVRCLLRCRGLHTQRHLMELKQILCHGRSHIHEGPDTKRPRFTRRKNLVNSQGCSWLHEEFEETLFVCVKNRAGPKKQLVASNFYYKH